MYQTKNLGLNITEMPKDKLSPWSFHTDLGYNFEAIDEKTLSHRNITNCLLEVPQDIKAECSNGTLTIKAGSKIWVPYGTEDKTREYPVGSAFLNANFTVMDTQYSNNKFFVCAEVQADITNSQATLDVNTRLLLIDITENSLSTYISTTSSDTQSTENNNNNYRTDLNLIQKTKDSILRTNVMSLPLLVVSSDSVNLYAEIKQVFNGMGYIGSTVFALPGVKGLVPNGRKEDGSINNIKQTLENVFIRSFTESSVSGDYITSLVDNFGGGLTGLELKTKVQTFYQNKKPDSNNTWWFDTEEIQWKYVETDSTITRRWWLDFGVCNVSNGKILSITPKKPFRAVDYNDFQTKITELETKIQTLEAAVKALQG